MNLKHCIYQFSPSNTYLSVTCFHWASWMKIALFYKWPRCSTADATESKQGGGSLSNQASTGWDVSITNLKLIFSAARCNFHSTQKQLVIAKATLRNRSWYDLRGTIYLIMRNSICFIFILRKLQRGLTVMEFLSRKAIRCSGFNLSPGTCGNAAAQQQLIN